MRKSQRHPERGAIAVLSAVTFIVVGGFLALSLNVGHKMNAKAQLQGAFDAGGLAGAATLDGSPQGIVKAEASAVKFATSHFLDSSAVAAGAADAIAGYWDRSTRSFFTDGQVVRIGDATVTLNPATTAAYYNAVKIGGGADGLSGHNQRMNVSFGAFIGNAANLGVKSSAIGVGGGPCRDSGCTLPMVIPSCALVDAGGNIACGTVVTLTFNHGHGKDIALADITQPSHNVNNSEARDQMTAGANCRNPAVAVGDVVALGNGNDFNGPLENTMYSPVNIVCSGGHAPYAGCPRREMAVVNIGTDCGVPMNQSSSVVGFVQVVIVDTNSGGHDASISAYIDCSGHSSAPSGCANFGFGANQYRLVQ